MRGPRSHLDDARVLSGDRREGAGAHRSRSARALAASRLPDPASHRPPSRPATTSCLSSRCPSIGTRLSRRRSFSWTTSRRPRPSGRARRTENSAIGSPRAIATTRQRSAGSGSRLRTQHVSMIVAPECASAQIIYAQARALLVSALGGQVGSNRKSDYRPHPELAEGWGDDFPRARSITILACGVNRWAAAGFPRSLFFRFFKQLLFLSSRRPRLPWRVFISRNLETFSERCRAADSISCLTA